MRQVGNTFHAGLNVVCGKDYTNGSCFRYCQVYEVTNHSVLLLILFLQNSSSKYGIY